MINLNSDDNQMDVFQEGIIKDSFDYAKVGMDNLKQFWIGSGNSTPGRIKNITSETNKSLTAINKSMIDPKNGNYIDNSSIIARARKSVLQFPIYITQTIRVNEAQIIAKMFERVYTTLVQTVLSQNKILDEDEANNLVFLKKFHTNLKQEAADVFVNQFYEPIDDIDKMMKESVFYSQQLTERCTVRFNVVPTTDRNLILENSRLMNEPLTGLFYLKEATAKKNDKDISVDETIDDNNESTVNKQVLSKKDLEEMAIDMADISGAERRLIDKSEKEIEEEVKRTMKGLSTEAIENKINDKIHEKREAEKKLDDAVEELKEKIKRNEVPAVVYAGHTYVRRISSEKSSHKKTTKVSSKNKEFKTNPVETSADNPKILLKDAEVRKINAMLPWTIEVSFRIKGEQGTSDRDVKYIIGIKSVLHLIRTQDLADDLKELVTGNIRRLQKVRYKTGEISFKDYFFNIKGLKADAAKNINYNKKWLNTLKRLGEYNKLNGTILRNPAEILTGGNVPIPNGTLILSQPDITALTNKTGIDLSSISNAKKLAKSLFLIAVVIVDSSAGTMRVLFPDSDNDWDVQSLSAIDAELAKTDNNKLMKELNSLVNK